MEGALIKTQWRFALIKLATLRFYDNNTTFILRQLPPIVGNRCK